MDGAENGARGNIKNLNRIVATTYLRGLRLLHIIFERWQMCVNNVSTWFAGFSGHNKKYPIKGDVL